jgi:rRNA maturation protein Nop10
MNKWAEYTFDICPFCSGPMGIFAPTYAFNFCFAQCPHCGGQSQSACVQDGGTTFQWIIPDGERNKSYIEAHKMVAGCF